MRKPTELRPVMTRIPEALRRRLEKEAARNGRSMNSEIIHRLEQSLTAPDLAQAVAEHLHQALAGSAIMKGLARQQAALARGPEQEEAADAEARRAAPFLPLGFKVPVPT